MRVYKVPLQHPYVQRNPSFPHIPVNSNIQLGCEQA